jgi:hypothetical protein
MKKNIFIKSLEFGENRIEQGVSFNELIEHLENDLNNRFRDKDKRAEFEKSFNVWFYDNFFLREVQKTRTGIREVPSLELMNQANDKKARLKGEAYFKLIEHKELTESRKSSRKAFYIATIATAITFFSVTYQIFFDGRKDNSLNGKHNRSDLILDSLIYMKISKIDTKIDSLFITNESKEQQALTKNIVHLADSTKSEDGNNK